MALLLPKSLEKVVRRKIPPTNLQKATSYPLWLKIFGEKCYAMLFHRAVHLTKQLKHLQANQRRRDSCICNVMQTTLLNIYARGCFIKQASMGKLN